MKHMRFWSTLFSHALESHVAKSLSLLLLNAVTITVCYV